MKYNDFRKQMLKVSEPRKHKVKGSLGVYDAYKWIRKNKWLNIGRPLKESEFYKIIRGINELLAEELILGNDVNLPKRMGRLEIRKHEATFKFANNEVKTNLPIDWDRTLKLWYENEEAYNQKTLIKVEEIEIFRVYYNKSLANFNNKSFYRFNINRDIKVRLKQQIKNKAIDAFKMI